jgi:hypothetical protein
LKYRLPNILEAYDILEASGINRGNVNALKLKRNIISSLGVLVDYSLIEGVHSYEDLLNDVDDMLLPLGEIADEIIVKIFDIFKKKDI